MDRFPHAEVVSFDLWKTLIKTNSTPSRTTRADGMFRLISPDMLYADFRALVKTVDIDSNDLSETDTKHYGPWEITEMVTERLGLPTVSQDKFDEFYAEQADRLLQYPPELMETAIPEVLAALKERYKIALISNTGFMNGKEMIGALDQAGIGDYFDYRIFSNEVGVAKPHRRIFDALATTAGVSGESIVHIGDNYRADYLGATAAGFTAVHLAVESIAPVHVPSITAFGDLLLN